MQSLNSPVKRAKTHYSLASESQRSGFAGRGTGEPATLTDVVKGSDTLSATLDGNLAEDDIIAVLCFVIEADQIEFETVSAAPATVETEEVAVVAKPQPVVVAPAVKAAASEAPHGRAERENQPAPASRPASA